ncbi:class I SAM-dependent methyltransferase [Neptunicella sp.]|uniref:class I SAM-dependent methyltransferase n=1 Tax=Neptunicella sp. TaxID=2125986 RepID=UPI003F692DAC
MTSSLQFLSQKLHECSKGIAAPDYIEHVIKEWYKLDPESWRWKEVEKFEDHTGKILDMACGVGTFFFIGLLKGYDVYGIEPEPWKLEYIKLRLGELGKLDELHRIVEGVGEKLPYPDETFDFISTYQTLEHVNDVDLCIDEMVRVLKPGGKIIIRAPDYNSFYEPHYCVPFLPKMNKKLAAIYLKILGKPLDILWTLNWTTAESIESSLARYSSLKVIDLSRLYKKRLFEKHRLRLPQLMQNLYLIKLYLRFFVNFKYYRKIYTFRAEKQIYIVVTKPIN